MTCESEIKLFGKILPMVVSGESTGAGRSRIDNRISTGFDVDQYLEDNRTSSSENDEGSESIDYENQTADKVQFQNFNCLILVEKLMDFNRKKYVLPNLRFSLIWL